MSKTRILALTAAAAALPFFAPGQTAGKELSPYFSAVNYPAEKRSFRLTALSDFQLARFGNNFTTGMLLAEYGIADRWTAGAAAEGQKILDTPAEYGGVRFNTYYRLSADDRFLNLTLYGEYQELNGAALYRREVTGFGPGDLPVPTGPARRTKARALQARAILYRDLGRLNFTFNFIGETALQAPRGSGYGYALGVFMKPFWSGGAIEDRTTMTSAAAPPALAVRRLGLGLEMAGALGDDRRFGVYIHSQQHYAGPVFTYIISPRWALRFQASFGLTDVSDPFMLRSGVTCLLGSAGNR